MQTINIVAHTEDASQIEAIKAFMKALKIKFEVTKQDKPCDTDKFYVLTSEQQQILDSQIKSDKSQYTDAEVLFADLKSKYEI
jgi:phosphoribosylamine-glycine ligase